MQKNKYTALCKKFNVKPFPLADESEEALREATVDCICQYQPTFHNRLKISTARLKQTRERTRQVRSVSERG